MPAYGGVWTLSQVAQAIKNNDWTGVPPTVVEYLIVAGGGGGGSQSSASGGGGGAGGLLQGSTSVALGASYFVTVGAGGTGGNPGTQGGASVFDATSSGAATGRIVATGGGYGGAYGGAGTAGGSGGGGGQANNSYGLFGGAGISGQGNAGGTAFVTTANTTYPYGGAGGGGAGTIGLSPSGSTTYAYGGNGGAGIISEITGTRVAYAGGGGGASHTSVNYTPLGGIGGGGSGANQNTSTLATAGTPNTGGGGGGNAAATGLSGGSGIVVIRYPGNIQYYTGGTLNYSNGFIVHTFYASGTLAPATPRLFARPDYQIARSLRFNGTNTYLNRTPAAGNQKTWTWSGWVKRSALGAAYYMPFGADAGAGTSVSIYFYNDYLNFGQGATTYRTTTQLFRDVSAWYHIVVVLDTTQSTASDRVKFWVNGAQITSFSTSNDPAQNANLALNSAVAHAIGADIPNSGARNFFGGYLTEINFIDGQALSPASFGYTEPSTGVWTPLQYTGSYGTNGFYLNFADNSGTTSSTLGKDLSSNLNNWTPNNFSITAGSGNSSYVDTPTNYGTDTGAGGEVRGNYATLNPLNASTTYVTVSDGNLTYQDTTVGGSFQGAVTTMFASSGKWYAEFTIGAAAGGAGFWGVGIASPPKELNFYTEKTTTGYVGYSYYGSTGQKATNDTVSSYGETYTTGDTISVAVDIDNLKVWFAKNGVWQAGGSPTAGTNSAFTIQSGFPYGFACNNGASATQVYIYANFGQRAFAYTAPSGFRAMCSQNLPESQVDKLSSKHFNAVIWTGSGSTPRSVGGIGFQPDLSWLIRREVGYGNWLYDVVRGTGKALSANSTAAEATYTQVGSFDPDGFTQTGAVDQGNNISGGQYVAWNWKAGGTAVTNTSGTITSSVSANIAAGFSVVTYTGNNTTGTVGHGLTTAPSLIIVKRRDSTSNWVVYSPVIGATQYLYLNTTAAAAAWAGFWGNTAPTSSVFTVSNDGATNASAGTYVAYCWAEVAGYSRFGSYIGNASTDGPFVYCGFRPKYVLIKNSTSVAGPSWQIRDSLRTGYNAANYVLYTNLTNVEYSTAANYEIDFLSNGFKIRTGTDAGCNGSGDTMIFAAFAESPFKYARAR